MKLPSVSGKTNIMTSSNSSVFVQVLMTYLSMIATKTLCMYVQCTSTFVLNGIFVRSTSRVKDWYLFHFCHVSESFLSRGKNFFSHLRTPRHQKWGIFLGRARRYWAGHLRKHLREFDYPIPEGFPEGRLWAKNYDINILYILIDTL
jgi:hypothetical protein